MIETLNRDEPRPIIVKLSSDAVVTDGSFNGDQLEHLGSYFAQLPKEKHYPVLITSGAIKTGRRTLLKANPDLTATYDIEQETLTDKQALSSIGQPILNEQYSQLFRSHGFNGASQFLASHSTLSAEGGAASYERTIYKTFSMNYVPTLNQNDAADPSEIAPDKDNDTLAEKVALVLSAAGVIIVLSDVPGLLDNNKEVIPIVKSENIAELHSSLQTNDLFDQTIQTKKIDGKGGIGSKFVVCTNLMVEGIPVQLMGVSELPYIHEAFTGNFGTLFIPDGFSHNDLPRITALAA